MDGRCVAIAAFFRFSKTDPILIPHFKNHVRPFILIFVSNCLDTMEGNGLIFQGTSYFDFVSK